MEELRGRIRLAHANQQRTPSGARGSFPQGATIGVIIMSWPGRPYEPGSIGAQTKPGGYTDWSFWDSYDIDGAFIWVAPPDVAELIVTSATHQRLVEQVKPAYLDAAPFTITIEEGASGAN